MAITRTQIARQLYQGGGGADFGAPDKAEERASTGYGNPSGGKAASKGFDQNAAPGGQSPEVYGASGPYNPEQALAAAKAQGAFDKENIIEKGFKTYGKSLYNRFPNNPKNELDYLRSLSASQRAMLSPGLRAKLETIDDEAEFDDYTTAGEKFTFDEFSDLTKFEPTEGLNFADYAAKFKGAPGLKYSGNVGNLEKYVTKRDVEGRPLEYGYKEKMGGDGNGAMSDYERRLLALEQAPSNTDQEPEEEEPFQRNFRLMADGGRAEFAEGGMPYEGGIMDLESSRQMYGLGKLVKKITRGVKKIAKSPIGKAALLYAGGTYLGGLNAFGGSGTFMANLKSGQGIGNLFNFGKNKLFGEMITGGNAAKGAGYYKKGLLSNKMLTGLAGTTALSYFMTPEEEEEQKLASYGADIDDPSYIMNNPSLYTNRRLAAEGGSMKEPVAKKTMPLLDMDGQEMDLREEGGFVPLGRMERADDVPARLSKNEFVFTADAVRNAGEGDVDKGAEVMYNMMKNLESGGDVSEESQGLEGAREMFQTSQRLEEVI
mgnify:CR=1 FL=1